MSWTIISSIIIEKIKGLTINKTKYEVYNSETNETYIVLHWPGIPCIIYNKEMDHILNKYKWWYSSQNGYAFTNIIENDTRYIISMHSIIINNKYDSETIENMKNKNLSVDHINYIKTFNIYDNLRIVNQSIQNSNRETRCDKIAPPKELQDIGIYTLPRYIRYDNSENKFIIERMHPNIEKLNKPFNTSGTKSTKVSIIYKYYDILKKLHTLNIQFNSQHNIQFVNKQTELYNIYNDISKLINGNDIVEPIDYNIININNDYTYLEKYLTAEEKAYDRGGMPEDSTVDINMLPKYCCYLKPTEKRGDCFYISRNHPHLKEGGINDIKTTSSKSVCINDKYHILLAKLKIIDENTGDDLKAALLSTTF